MRFEIEADIPDGYEPTGEFREPAAKEWFISEFGGLEFLPCPKDGDYGDRIILRRKPWRAEDEGRYWFISGTGEAVPNEEYGFREDKIRHKIGNYYKTREQAERAAELVRNAYREAQND
jgi:hypothetical protein